MIYLHHHFLDGLLLGDVAALSWETRNSWWRFFSFRGSLVVKLVVTLWSTKIATVMAIYQL